MKIWQQCYASKYFIKIHAKPWRIVESQSILTSRDLVDTIAEYEILEDMLESAKPRIETNTHYLIFTPFRYPPLKYGSRFGRKFEPSLWYGSLEITTALAEIAYYRLLFLHDTVADLKYIHVALTAFQALLKTNKGIDLCASPFSEYQQQISAPDNYTASQQLGSAMREANVEAFIYFSSRSPKLSKNIAAFTQHVFCKKEGQYAFNFHTWQCMASKLTVDFTCQSTLEQVNFSADEFSKDGLLTISPEWINSYKYT